MTRAAPFWTAEKDEAAQALWRRGLSGREVAKLVGASSQAAVIGRMWRLGAKRPAVVALLNHSAGTGGRKAWRAQNRPKKAEKGFQGVHLDSGDGRRTGPLLVEQPLPQQTPVLCSPRPWLSREDWECAYPVAGEGESLLSCCNTPAVRGYCHAHRAAMFHKPRGSLFMVAKAVEARGG